jgi:aminoglycoside 3-N-acetyltransferase
VIVTGVAGREELSLAALVTQLETLGVRRGGVLLVHSSFRAVRPIEKDPLLFLHPTSAGCEE